MRITSLRFSTRSIFVLAAFAATSAFAQTGAATLTGTVTDAATKQPIADVVVTATSPNLQGEQIVVTDAAGLYRLPQLPPGTYTVRLEKEAYKPYSRGDVQLRADRTIRVNIELLPEAIQAPEVVVVGTTPTIDVGSTSTGVSIGQEFVNHIALVRPGSKAGASRSFESLAEIAPGAQSDTYGVSINGTTSPENSFIIDGLSVNDAAFGVLNVPLTVDFIQEVNVITGGYMPEFGRATGGIMNVVTKSGSNEFHGSVFGYWSPGVLDGPRAKIHTEGSVFQTSTKSWNIGDFGAELGGPILKDKLWFYAGFAPSFTRYQLTRNINTVELQADGKTPVKDANGFTVFDPIPGTTQSYFADSRGFQYIGKLTYLISPDHQLTLSVFGTPENAGGPGKVGIAIAGLQPTGTPDVTSLAGELGALTFSYANTTNDVSLKLASSFMDKHVLLDVSLGWYHATSDYLPQDGSKVGSTEGLAAQPLVIIRRNSPTYHSVNDFVQLPDPSVCEPAGSGTKGTPNAGIKVVKCPVKGYLMGGPGFISSEVVDRYQAKAVGTYLFSALGHHVAKAGIDFESLGFRHDKVFSGNVWLRESTRGSSYTEARGYGYLQGPDDVVREKVKTAQSNSLTSGAFLQDSWSVADLVTVNAGLRYDTQQIYGTEGLGVSLNNEWSPRIGLVYDFTQQGRSKIFANYARFYEGMPLDISDRSFPSEDQAAHVIARLPKASGTTGPGCDPIADKSAPKNSCLDERNYIDVSGSPTDISPHVIITGIPEREAIDPNLMPQSSDEIVVGGEYEVVPDSRAGLSYTRRKMNSVIEDMSRDEATTYFLGNPGYGIAKDFPKAVRDYDAVTAYFTKSFSNDWLAQVSYTYSYLRGNYAGLFRPETGQLDPNINSDFDLISLLDNRYGPLPGDATHQVKLFGAKVFPITSAMAVDLGVSYRGTSGQPMSYLASHPLYGSDEVFVLPRGAAGRTPFVHRIDGHLGLTYHLSKDNAVTVSVDAFNLFNFQAATAEDERLTSSDLRPYNVDPASKFTPQQQICIAGGDNGGNPACAGGKSPLVHTDGSSFDPGTEINPNLKNVTQFQSPRSIRFGAKITF